MHRCSLTSHGYGHPSSSPVPSTSPQATPSAKPEPTRPAAATSAPATVTSTASPSVAPTLPVTGVADTWLIVFLGCLLVLCGIVIITLLGMATRKQARPRKPVQPKRRYVSRHTHAGAKK